MTMEVRGRELLRGIPGTVTVTDTEIRALGLRKQHPRGDQNGARAHPPELSADIADHGVVLAGGGALLKNLDGRIRKETSLPVSIAEDPLTSVVVGAGKMLEDFGLLRRISMN
jgi:rod shape-determining protein MreB